MNAVQDLQTAAEQLTADYQQRLAKLQQAQAEAARIIEETATLEIAEQERIAKAERKAQAIDKLNSDMVAAIEHAKRTVALADEARAKIAEAQRIILTQRDLLNAIYHECAIVAGEVTTVVQSNREAFDDKTEAQRFAVSKLMALLPLGINAVGDEQMLYRYRKEYQFPSFGYDSQQRLIANALVMIR